MQISGIGEGDVVAEAPSGVSFDDFYLREYPGMLRLAVGLIDHRARAEELVQDAFERTLMRWGRLHNPGGFLHRVLVNAAHSELRRRRVARRFRIEPTATVAVPAIEDEVMIALTRLTPQRRIALVLRFLDDRSEADVARIMGCRVGTVKSLVSRGLVDLREVITS